MIQQMQINLISTLYSSHIALYIQQIIIISTQQLLKQLCVAVTICVETINQYLQCAYISVPKKCSQTGATKDKKHAFDTTMYHSQHTTYHPLSVSLSIPNRRTMHSDRIARYSVPVFEVEVGSPDCQEQWCFSEGENRPLKEK